MSLLAQLLKPQKPPSRLRRSRLTLGDDFDAVYAVGDVHGRLDLLLRMEEMIRADAAGVPGKKLLVMLGDYVDRGPQSAQVLDHLIAPPPEGFTRICLAGNHEQMMIEFVRQPTVQSDWLQYGGVDTLISYGVTMTELEAAVGTPHRLRQLVDRAIPRVHLNFVETLPSLLTMTRYTFVHAGIRPGVGLDAQEDEDLLWIRHVFITSADDFGSVVVHGHTPIRSAEIRPNRISIDTGAFATGLLSGVKLKPGDVRILEARLGSL